MVCARCNAATRPGQRFCTQCGTPLVVYCARCSGQVYPGDIFCGSCGSAIAQVGVHTSAPQAPVPQPYPYAQSQQPAWGQPVQPAWSHQPVAPTPQHVAPQLPPQYPPAAPPVAPTAAQAPQTQSGLPAMTPTPETAAVLPVPADEAAVAQEATLDDFERTAAIKSRMSKELLAKARADSLATSTGERRTATVLMADVKGFTSLSEKFMPEDVQEVMNCWYDRVAEIVFERYEGFIIKTVGDCVMASFGAPVAVEQAPERAVRAALAMQRALPNLEVDGVDLSGVELSVRIGINTGDLVAGGMMADGIRKFDVLGPTVNIAARLESAAPPGGILVGEAVYNRCKDLFEFEDMGALSLKNVSEPVQAYVAKTEKAWKRSHQTEGMAPLVGRADQLAQLRESLGLVCEGKGQAVSIVGEAGVGKSRLISEIHETAGTQGFGWAEGHCLTYGANVAYLPFQEILREATGIEPLDDDDIQREKLETMLRETLSEDATHLAPALGAVIQIPYPGSQFESVKGQERGDRIHEAIEEYIRLRAKTQPLVLVLDDLQWIDSSSEGLLAHLVDEVADKPIFLVLSHRPSYEMQIAAPHHRLVALGRLSSEDSDVLLRHNLGGIELRADVRAGILAKADGNPFYLEEIVRALRARGALTSSSDISLDMVPDSLQEIIMSRVDRVAGESECARKLLQTAAIIGPRFAVPLLERVGGLDRRALEECLQLLTERQFIVPVDAGAARQGNGPGMEREYRFEHNLVHEQIGESIVLRQRTPIHVAIAEAMEDLYAGQVDQHAPALAFHYDQGAKPDKALHYYKRAASDDLRNAAFREVIKGCSRATELLDEVATSDEATGIAAEVCILRSQAEAFLGNLEGGMELSKRALELAISIGDKQREGEAYDKLAFVSNELGEFDRAKQYYRMAMKVFEEGGFDDRVSGCRHGVFAIMWQTGDFEGARRGFEEELAGMRERQAQGKHLDPNELVSLLSNLGSTLADLGEYQKALECFSEAEPVIEAHGDRLGQAFVMANMGLSHYALGDFPTSLAYCVQAADIFRAMSYRLYEGFTTKDQARCHIEMARYEEALNAARNAIEIGREVGVDTVQVDAMAAEAEASLHLGLFDSAYDISNRALDMARAAGSPGEAECALVAGLVALHRGHPDAAIEHYNRALQRSREMKSRLGEARALVGHGNAWLEQGKYDEALAAFEEALDIASSMGVPVPQIEANLGTAMAYYRRDKLGPAEKRLTLTLGEATKLRHVRTTCEAALMLGRLKRRAGDRQTSLDLYVRARKEAKKAVDGCGAYADRGLASRTLMEIQTETISLLWEMGAVEKASAKVDSDLLDLIEGASATDMDRLRQRSPEVEDLVNQMLAELGMGESVN